MSDIAIVIPYYNINFFESTLDSLADQNNKQFKVYIGDDASPDNPAILLEKYKNKFDFVYHRFENNLGGKSLVQQWNRCLDLCNDEEWVMILGDDDVLGNSCIDAFYTNLKEIESMDITVVRFATQVIDENGIALSKVHQHPKTEKAVDFLMRKFRGGIRSSLSEYVFKKEMIDGIGFKDFPLGWHSDDLAFMEFSNFGIIYTINILPIYIRRSGLNISCQTGNLALKNIATFQFYHYLLSNCNIHFTKESIQILLNRIEKTLLDNKKKAKYWLKLFVLYFKFLEFRRFFQLGKKIKKSIR